jgi:hypothetical protein
VLEKVVLSYRVLLILSFISTLVWLGFLIGRFKPVAAPSDKPKLNATIGAPWHAMLFFILFVIAEIIGACWWWACRVVLCVWVTPLSCRRPHGVFLRVEHVETRGT